MAEFLNEHEQVEAIKSFWKRYGNAMLSLLVLCVLVMVGFRYYQAYQDKKLAQASVAFQELLQVVNANNSTAIVMQANNLMQDSAHTPYAPMAALLLAQEQVNAKQLSAAKTSLNWVIQHAHSTQLVAIATSRLARILIADGQGQAALDLLKSPPAGFIAPYAIVRGDAYVALKDYVSAYKAYQLALTNLSPNNDLIPLIIVKLSNLPVTASGQSDQALKG